MFNECAYLAFTGAAQVNDIDMLERLKEVSLKFCGEDLVRDILTKFNSTHEDIGIEDTNPFTAAIMSNQSNVIDWLINLAQQLDRDKLGSEILAKMLQLDNYHAIAHASSILFDKLVNLVKTFEPSVFELMVDQLGEYHSFFRRATSERIYTLLNEPTLSAASRNRAVYRTFYVSDEKLTNLPNKYSLKFILSFLDTKEEIRTVITYLHRVLDSTNPTFCSRHKDAIRFLKSDRILPETLQLHELRILGAPIYNKGMMKDFISLCLVSKNIFTNINRDIVNTIFGILTGISIKSVPAAVSVARESLARVVIKPTALNPSTLTTTAISFSNHSNVLFSLPNPSFQFNFGGSPLPLMGPIPSGMQFIPAVSLLPLPFSSPVFVHAVLIPRPVVLMPPPLIHNLTPLAVTNIPAGSLTLARTAEQISIAPRQQYTNSLLSSWRKSIIEETGERAAKRQRY